MTGSSKTIAYRGNINFYNLVLNGTVTLKGVDYDTRAIRVQGNTFTMDGDATVTSTGQESIELYNTMAGGTFTLSAPATNIENLYDLDMQHDTGTITVPACTTKIIRC